MRNRNYRNDLLDDLRNDPEYAAGYLSAAKADSKEAFLVALRDVTEARMGMKKAAKAAKVNRENLYRALSRKGNPSVETLDAVLCVLGIEQQFVTRRPVSPTRGTLSLGIITESEIFSTSGSVSHTHASVNSGAIYISTGVSTPDAPRGMDVGDKYLNLILTEPNQTEVAEIAGD